MIEYITTSAKKIAKKDYPPDLWKSFLLLLRISGTTLKRLVTSMRQKSRTVSDYRRDVTYAVLRRVFDEGTAEQAQYVHPSTEDGYNMACNRWKCPTDTVELDSGAKAHWIGKRNATYVLLYFHGGGYMLPATKGHWDYQKKLQEKMTQHGQELSILSLSYILTPNEKYPTQLRQAVSVLEYLVQLEGRDPATVRDMIIVGGDSAGGNLVSALLLHLAKQHPDIDQLELHKPLCGAILISPWVTFNPDQPSVAKNAKTDYVTTKAIHTATANFLQEGEKPDAYAEPLSAPIAWWAIASQTVVQQLFIWAGGSEILHDSIVEFATSIREGFGISAEGKVRFIVTPGEAHEQMIVDPLLKFGSETAGGTEIEKCLLRMLSN